MRKRNYILSALSFVFFVFVGFFFLGFNFNNPDLLKTLLTATTFMFGLFIAFSIASSHTRINNLSTALKQEEGYLTGFYLTSEVFGEKIHKKVQKKVDMYLQQQLDYYLSEYHLSNPAFKELSEYIYTLKPKTKAQEITYNRMLQNIWNLSINRKQVEKLIRESMLKFEWFVIYLLLSIIIITLFLLNDGSLFTLLLTALISSAAYTFTLILKDLDDLFWKERNWIWDPLETLFKELDLPPYYPAGVLMSGRAEPDKGQEIRVAYYPHPYPDMSDKKVKTLTV